MKVDAIVRHIAGMRDRDNVRSVLSAAEKRDEELMEHESYRASKRVFSRFAHLKRGDLVYVHLPRDKCGNKAYLFGRALVVWAVHPKNRNIEVRVPGLTAKMGERGVPRSIVLKWSALDRLKISEKPTPEALAHSLKGGEA